MALKIEMPAGVQHGVDVKRSPGRRFAIGKGEAPRHDADHSVQLAVNANGLANHVRGATEAALPQSVGEDQHALAFIRGHEHAPELGTCLEHREQARRHPGDPYAFGIGGRRPGDRPGAPGREAVEGSRPFGEGQVGGVGDAPRPLPRPALARLGEPHETPAPGPGKRRQQDAVHHAEEQRGRGNADRQRRDHEHGVPRLAGEPPDGVPELLEKPEEAEDAGRRRFDGGRPCVWPPQLAPGTWQQGNILVCST
jgi:hypothetical protein